MVYSEPFTGANYNNGSLPPFPVYQTSDMMESQCWYGDTSLAASGLSEVQMNATYDVTENTQTDALAGIFNQNPLPPLIHHMESKNYDSSVERSGLTFYGPQERSRNGGLDNLVVRFLLLGILFYFDCLITPLMLICMFKSIWKLKFKH